MGSVLKFTAARWSGWSANRAVARRPRQWVSCDLVQSPGKIISGEVRINGIDLRKLDERQMREKRWRDVALVPQGAMNSLNPVMRSQRADHVTRSERTEGHRGAVKLRKDVLELLNLVGLPARVYNHVSA